MRCKKSVVLSVVILLFLGAFTSAFFSQISDISREKKNVEEKTISKSVVEGLKGDDPEEDARAVPSGENELNAIAGSPWSKFRGDKKNTGLSPYEVSDINGNERWSFDLGGEIQSSPAIGEDGTIYIGSRDGNLYAVNPDGTERWTFETGDMITSSPAIGEDGKIYIGSRDGNLYAVNPDGREKWSFD
ncbi:MAG: PQQ-binding-like beta-propeller repeat protein, partial [Candidatus Thermoplasmatota archaeon]